MIGFLHGLPWFVDSVDPKTGTPNVQGLPDASLGQLRILTILTLVRIPLHFRHEEVKGGDPLGLGKANQGTRSIAEEKQCYALEILSHPMHTRKQVMVLMYVYVLYSAIQLSSSIMV